MILDNSHFLSFGPNQRTILFGVRLDEWWKWWVVAIYTFVSTCIAAFTSDSVMPWITNTIQDHKTKFIPYNKSTCLVIIQVFTIYAVIMSVIGLFVALTQVDFMLIRLIADLIVNHFTTIWFLQDKIVDPEKYNLWCKNGLAEEDKIDTNNNMEGVPLCTKKTTTEEKGFDEENGML